MSFTFKSLFMETITSPRDAAQKIIDIGVSRQTSILSIVFTVCITVILFFLDLSSSENSIVLPLLMHHPLMLASVMTVSYTHLTLPICLLWRFWLRPLTKLKMIK